jgi:branched-chain amino acid transport system permease protein
VQLTPGSGLHDVLSITIAQTAPVLPYLLMVLMLVFRPTGLLGTRET